MKKLQLLIVILSVLWCSHVFAAVFTVMPASGSSYWGLEYSLQRAVPSAQSNTAGTTPLFLIFSSNVSHPPYAFNDVETKDINSDTDIDTADSDDPDDGFELNDRSEPLTSSAPKEIPSLIINSIALKVLNFPLEVSRLRI